jgi:hypothetical protein
MISGWFLILGLPLLIMGTIAFSGISVEGYAERAAALAVVGLLMLFAGSLLVLSAFVLVGVRAIAQQHLDILLRAKQTRRQCDCSVD